MQCSYIDKYVMDFSAVVKYSGGNSMQASGVGEICLCKAHVNRGRNIVKLEIAVYYLQVQMNVFRKK